MRITFVNHASFIIEYGAVRLICDPWMEGTAFDNGWALLSRTRLQYEDFKDITHIWFSHEHPDHFAPPNLLKIPLEYRKRITVLFQETTDRKVAGFCKKLEFKEQVELKKDTYYAVGSGLEIRCDPYTDGDSYAVFRTATHTLLNLNDCVVDTAEKASRLAHSIGKVDVLFTQFGYANKVGNTNDVDLRLAASKEKLERIRQQTAFLEPKAVVPFASFIHFCHTENAYMNKGANRIDAVDTFVQQELGKQCVVLYPGDTWSIEGPHDPTDAIQRYSRDFAEVDARSLLTSDPVDIGTLKKNGDAFVQTLLAGYPTYRNKIHALGALIHVTDHGNTFSLSGKEGFREHSVDPKTCDVSLGSEALNYCFSQLWGGDTLNVNARFQIPEGGQYRNFRMFGAVASQLNRKEGIAELFPTTIDRAIAKTKRILGIGS